MADEPTPSTPSAPEAPPLNPASGHDSWPPLTGDTERADPNAKLAPAAAVTPRTKTTPTAEPLPLAAAEDGDEGDDDGTVEVQGHKRGQPGKPLTPAQRRINQAVARQRDAERRAEDAERRYRDLEARQAPTNGHGTPPPPAPNRDPQRAKPDQRDFANYEDFLDAVIDWKNDRFASALFQTQAQLQQQAQQQGADAAFNERRDNWIKDHPDYPDVVAAATDIEVSHPMEQFFRHDPAGIAVIDYLARHPEEAKDLARLAPGPAFVKLGRLAQTLDAPHPAGVAPQGRIPTPRAPAPLTPVGAGPHRSTDPSEIDFGPEYMRRNNEAERQRRRAGLR